MSFVISHRELQPTLLAWSLFCDDAKQCQQDILRQLWDILGEYLEKKRECVMYQSQKHFLLSCHHLRAYRDLVLVLDNT